MTSKGTQIKLTGDDGFTLGAYHVAPEGQAKGGLVVLMEVFGVNGHIREVCDGYAADGYEVVAPALYDRAQRDFEVGYTADDLARARKIVEALMFKHTQNDVQAAIDFLHAKGHSRVHITGYCYGGTATWVTACRCSGLSTAVGYYGKRTVDYIGEDPRCPVVLHLGSRDTSIPPEAIEQIRAKHPEVVIHIYDAEHGFNSDRRANYDAASAKLARERTLAFFEQAR